MNRIGIDLGGTKIEGILLSDTNKVIERKRIQTKQEEGYNSIINRIVKLITNIRSRSDKECQIGICTPGALDLETGILKNSNTTCLIGKSIKVDIENKLGRSIAIDNDANCFAMAEALLGAGKNYDIIFGVIGSAKFLESCLETKRHTRAIVYMRNDAYGILLVNL